MGVEGVARRHRPAVAGLAAASAVAACVFISTLAVLLLLSAPLQQPSAPFTFLPPGVTPYEDEAAYTARTLARLASLHTCSGRTVDLTDDPDDGVAPLPVDAVRLAVELVEELKGFGLADAGLSNGRAGMAVVATLPASAYPGTWIRAAFSDGPPASASTFCGAPSRAPAIALMAHLDQACSHPAAKIPTYDGSSMVAGAAAVAAAPSTPVRPRVFEAWDGAPVPFPDAPVAGISLSAETTPRAASAVNRTLIVGSGGAPLGADGLGGVVSILALVRRWALARAAARAAAAPAWQRQRWAKGGSARQRRPPRLWSSDPGSLPLALSSYPPTGPLRVVFTPGGETASSQFLLDADDLTDGGGLALGAAFFLDAEVPGDVRYESPTVRAWAVRFDAPTVQPAQGPGFPGDDYPGLLRLAHCDPRLAAARFVAALADDPDLGIEVADPGSRAPVVTVLDVSVGEPRAMVGGGGGGGRSDGCGDDPDKEDDDWPPSPTPAEAAAPVDANALRPRPPPSGARTASTAVVTLRVGTLDADAEAAAAAGIQRLVAGVLAGYDARARAAAARSGARPKPPCLSAAAAPLAAPPIWASSWDLMGRDAGPARLARAALRGAVGADGRPPPPPVSTPTRHITDAVPFSVAGLPTLLLASGWHAAHGPLEWATAEELTEVTDGVAQLAGRWLTDSVLAGWCPADEGAYGAGHAGGDGGPAP